MSSSDHFNQLIDRFETRDDSISGFANRLRELGIIVCSFENLTSSQTRPLTLTGLTISEILDRAVRQNPGYQWIEVSPGLANLFPMSSVLDSPAPNLRIFSKGAWRLLNEDLNIGEFGIQIYEEFGGQDGPPITIVLQNTDLRSALNAVVGQLDRLAWHITGRPDAYYLSFTVAPFPRSSRERAP